MTRRACASSATSCSPIHDCPVPVVAKVDGLCVGAGLGLALAADLTWCSDRARFSAIFAKRGLSLDFGTSWLLRQRIGVHKAKELAFTAKMRERRRGVRARARQRGRARRRARRRRRVRWSTTIAAGPPIALVDDQARARQRVDGRRSPRRSRSRRSPRASTCRPTTCARRSSPTSSAARRSSRAGSEPMATDGIRGLGRASSTTSSERRDASRAMGGDERLAQAPRRREARRPGPHRPPARPGVVPRARHARRRRRGARPTPS